MNEQKDPEIQTHKEATIIPWYLAGTLSAQERLQVETHLAGCPECRAELDEMKRTKAIMKTAIQERQGPSPEVFSKVIARIREEREAPSLAKSPVNKDEASWWAGIQAWLQSLFAIPWVPALATILIVGQSALLLTTVGERSGLRQQPGPIIERGIPKAPTPQIARTIRVGFQEDATEGEIRALIREIDGRIVDGPSPQGLYTVEIPASDSSSLETTLQTLRAHTHVVRLAQSASP